MFKDVGTDKSKRRRLVFAEGQDRRVLRAVQSILEANLAIPILIGEVAATHQVIEQEGLRYRLEKDVQIVSPEDSNQFRDLYLREALSSHFRWDPRQRALLHQQSRNTPIAARLVTEGGADCVICGMTGRSIWHSLQLAETLCVNSCTSAITLHAIIRNNRWVFLGSPTSGCNSPTAIAKLVVSARAYLDGLCLNSNTWICADKGDGEEANFFNRLLMQSAGMLETNVSETGLAGAISLPDILGGRLWTQFGPGDCDLVIFRTPDAQNLVRMKLRDVAGTISIGPIETTFNNKAHVVPASFSERELFTAAVFATTGTQCLSVLDNSTHLEAGNPQCKR